LIEAFTYRMNPHTTNDDPRRYQVGSERETWKLKDPIERVRVNLVRHEHADKEFFDSVQAEADELAAGLREFCNNMPDPGHDRMFSQVYADGSEAVAAQRESYMDYVAGFAGGEH
jgi:pyruvate dehydrogenase E1 component alpha subunit